MTQQNEADDKRGEALNQQRFQMLEDISKELAGEVVFPISFNTTMKLRQELQSPDLPIEKVANLVGADPLIAARLIHMSNSAFYGRNGTPIKSLPMAITRLGLDVVRTTALAFAMNQLLRSKEMLTFRELAHILWGHTIRSAVAARVLARNQKPCPINPDEAFLAGLVHDLGAFYMLYRAAQYPELRQRPDTVKHLIMQWHESIGVSLLNALGLPEEIVESVIDHDHPRAVVPTTIRTLSDVVYLSNILAGAHLEWFYQDIKPPILMENNVREVFAGLIDEIETDTQTLLAILE